MILDNKLKKQLISLINTNIGQVVKDINEIKHSPNSKTDYIMTCTLVTGNIRECSIDKHIVDNLNKKIVKWL
jgi:hypothetical protein